MEAAWTFEYRRETDRTRRADILKRAAAEDLADKSVEIRQKLFDARYDNKNGYDIDYFIRGFVNLQSLKRRVYLPGEKKRLRREVEGIKKDWQFDLCASYGETGARALHDELYNLTLLYIELCKRDKTYNSILWGMGHIGENKQTNKIIVEINEVAGNIPSKVDAEDELRPFTEAAMEALRSVYPNETADME